VLHEGLPLSIPAARHDGLVDAVSLRGQAGAVQRQAPLRCQADRSVQRHPALHLGVDELLLSTAHLPDAIVGPLPVVRHRVQHLAQVAPEVIGGRRPSRE
jgi:hypothetical protein